MSEIVQIDEPLVPLTIGDTNVVTMETFDPLYFEVSVNSGSPYLQTIPSGTYATTSVDSSNRATLYSFLIGPGTFQSDVTQLRLYSSENFVYSIKKDVSIDYASNLSVNLNGVVESSFYVEKTSQSTNVVGTGPNRFRVLVNGQPYSDWLSMTYSSYEFIDYPIEVPSTGIQSIAFEFDTINVVNSAKKVSFGLNISREYSLKFYFLDAMSLEIVETPPYVPILSNIFEGIKSLPGNIYNTFFKDVEPAAGSEFQEYVEAKKVLMTTLEDELNSLVKPDPGTLVPDITDIVDSTDSNHTAYMDVLSGLLGNTMITNMLLIVFSLAFVSYVLFGKKG